MKRDSKEANLVQLAENLQLCIVGDVSCSLGQDSWLEVGEMVDLQRTKGLTGMAAARTYLTCCVSVPHLPVPLFPNPDSHFYAVGQYPEPSPHIPLLPAHPFFGFEQSSNWVLPSGHWAAIPPKKRLSQELHALLPPLPRPGLVPERGSPPAPPSSTVSWTLNGLLTLALCCRPRWGRWPGSTPPVSSGLQRS